MSELWSAEVVSAVAAHMNEDHAEDNLLLVRRLGARPSATQARMTGMDAAGLVFAATVGGRADGETGIRVPWLTEPVDRADIRAQVVALHALASAHGS